MKSTDFLTALSNAYAGRRGVRLEFSVRLTPGRVEKTGRYCVWVGHTPLAAFAVRKLLRDFGAPPEVIEQPLAVADALCLSHGIAMGRGELRYYRHSRTPETLADDYRAWRWRPGHPAVDQRRYAVHYMPETPEGLRPLDLVPDVLRPSFAMLLEEPRLNQASAFWVRQGTDGQPDQLDVAFPWCPPVVDLPGMRDLETVLTLPARSGWKRLPVRHVAVSLTSKEPEITLYASAPLVGAWPTNQAQLRQMVKKHARKAHLSYETEVYSKVPPKRSKSDDMVGTFYNGDISLWQRVLGQELHYHAGVFDDQTVSPGPQEMELAQRRAVTDLYPFLPKGKRIYDVGCGWGGPMSMWVRDLGSPTLGLTISRDQFRHVASLGLPVRLGNAEDTLPPGHFDCAVLLESFCHMRDKDWLLRVLRLFCGRLVMRVNCQDAAPPGTVFGGTMHMISSADLRQMLERSGWTIRHWLNRRHDTLPSFDGWVNALRSVPPTDNPHIEVLRAWSARGVAIKSAWADNNPLIEVVAD